MLLADTTTNHPCVDLFVPTGRDGVAKIATLYENDPETVFIFQSIRDVWQSIGLFLYCHSEGHLAQESTTNLIISIIALLESKDIDPIKIGIDISKERLSHLSEELSSKLSTSRLNQQSTQG